MKGNSRSEGARLIRVEGREAAIHRRSAIRKAFCALFADDPAQYCVVGEECSQASPTLEPEESADTHPDERGSGAAPGLRFAGGGCCGDDHGDAAQAND